MSTDCQGMNGGHHCGCQARLIEARRVLEDTLAAFTVRYDANIGATLVADIKRVLGHDHE